MASSTTTLLTKTRKNPFLSSSLNPLYLTWRRFGSSSSACVSEPTTSNNNRGPGIKILESFKEEFEIGSRLISFETGKIARFANGAVVMGMEDTNVLSTVASSKGDCVKDFLPLTVDYQEKQFAQGVIPTTYMRREGAPKERELLCGRIIDRPIRPLFPRGFYHEVQVMASVLSSDGKQDPDILAANATSAALMLSDIPWGGPIGVIRIGRIDGKFVVNPSMDELSLSDLNLVYACTRDKTLMIDVQAREISERDLESALRIAHPEARKDKKKYKLSLISETTLGKIKGMAEAPIEAVFTDPTYGKFERGEALEKITQNVRKVLEEESDEESLKVLPKAVDTVRKQQDIISILLHQPSKTPSIFSIEIYDSSYSESPVFSAATGLGLGSARANQVFRRGLHHLLPSLDGFGYLFLFWFRLDYLVSQFEIRCLSAWVLCSWYCVVHLCIGLNLVELSGSSNLESEYWIDIVRRRVFEKGLRVDGRSLDEVRPLYCEVGNLPILHGSSIFSRGDTQVLCTVTLGAPGDAQRLDSLVGPPTKRFMLHYSFPPFSINEVGKRGGLNRREVGHGTLAEKALLAVLPPEEDFRYTVRLNSEVMASDGSTSMATVCGGSMALMDASIPVREHVAGVSVGLFTEVDQDTGMIKDYRILTDILGLEDHLGDMDFKIAGTRRGVTAIQLDIKPAGIPLDIICESLEHALKGRLQILDHMERHINAPRTQDERNSPRLASLKYSNESLRCLIGPQGVLKRKIELATGVRMSVSDGTLTILAKNQKMMDNALEMVDSIIGREIEVGGIYKGVVSSVKEYGAFVEFNGGQQGLLHISELSHDQVSRVSDVVSVGQHLSLMVIAQDIRGNIKLSLKAATPGNELKKSVSKGSVTPKEQALNAWASFADVPNDPEVPDLTPNRSSVSEDENQGGLSSSSSSILIRSAAECDEEEKTSDVIKCHAKIRAKSSKSSRSKKVLGLNHQSKTNPSLEDDDIRSLSSVGGTSSKKVTSSRAKTPAHDDGNGLVKREHETSTSAKSLKLGDKLNAKVYQIRAQGIVLDLGGGIRGMYRFKENGKQDFEIGEELRVQCSSFSVKGVPVVSLLEDGCLFESVLVVSVEVLLKDEFAASFVIDTVGGVGNIPKITGD
ncbi:hypothetical protein IFM89_011035 [Coptis chinensis]|uniref:Polyribonucleotide nucleotidyltransferase 2, mitochondrial n=1 Tax=Coptis chinensis TaxID=261450 RepID=A0A835IJV6_9MAGN|nr:hypothetical protein IFM89_011035 [Coptis chinensis]